MTYDPRDEPCYGCGREKDECMCPEDLGDDFDPLEESQEFDWLTAEPGDESDDEN